MNDQAGSVVGKKARITCPKGHSLLIDPKHLGKALRCPKAGCNEAFVAKERVQVKSNHFLSTPIEFNRRHCDEKTPYHFLLTASADGQDQLRIYKEADGMENALVLPFACVQFSWAINPYHKIEATFDHQEQTYYQAHPTNARLVSWRPRILSFRNS